MRTPDYGLRYVSPRRWCWRADDGSWRDVATSSAKRYLAIEYGLSLKRSRDSLKSPVEAVMDEASKNYRVDLAGDYRWDSPIFKKITAFSHHLPIDQNGDLRAGEYLLPTGERLLLTRDVHIALMA